MFVLAPVFSAIGVVAVCYGSSQFAGVVDGEGILGRSVAAHKVWFLPVDAVTHSGNAIVDVEVHLALGAVAVDDHNGLAGVEQFYAVAVQLQARWRRGNGEGGNLLARLLVDKLLQREVHRHVVGIEEVFAVGSNVERSPRHTHILCVENVLRIILHRNVGHPCLRVVGVRAVGGLWRFNGGRTVRIAIQAAARKLQVAHLFVVGVKAEVRRILRLAS